MRRPRKLPRRRPQLALLYTRFCANYSRELAEFAAANHETPSYRAAVVDACHPESTDAASQSYASAMLTPVLAK